MFHITPLHYLPLILRSGELMSKTKLVEAGFNTTHFRKRSRKQDLDRGFADYVHLTVREWPDILQSKLRRGFPHVRLRLEAKSLGQDYLTCRYNIAMSRSHRRTKSPSLESPENGYYLPGLDLPVAREATHQRTMLANSDKHMLEVLVHGKLSLDSHMVIECFCARDVELVLDLLARLGHRGRIVEKVPHYDYPVVEKHIEAVTYDLNRFLTYPDWRGRGLDFDDLT